MYLVMVHCEADERDVISRLFNLASRGFLYLFFHFIHDDFPNSI